MTIEETPGAHAALDAHASLPSRASLASLASLGWDDAFAAAFAAVGEGSPARVIAEHRSLYVVSDGASEGSAIVAGRMRHDAADDPARLPAVGDWVAVDGRAPDSGAGHAHGRVIIRAVLPRRSAFLRKTAGDETVAQVAAANVDVALLAAALPDDVNPRRLERFAAMAWEGGAVPVVVLTKRDLCDGPTLASAIARARGAAPGADVIAISAATGDGLDDLATHVAPGRTAVLLGASGAGKSTLVNALLGADHLRTAAVRNDGKGRHTTTHRELVRLGSGALLIDTPGVRELQLWGGADGLDAAFEDVAAAASGCRFTDCSHGEEPGCAVLEAVARGALDQARLDAWRALGRELAWLARRQDERAMHDERARHKSIQRLARVHIKRKYE